jgi:hypothetical protein
MFTGNELKDVLVTKFYNFYNTTRKKIEYADKADEIINKKAKEYSTLLKNFGINIDF